jgi:hypothetical protein
VDLCDTSVELCVSSSFVTQRDLSWRGFAIRVFTFNKATGPDYKSAPAESLNPAFKKEHYRYLKFNGFLLTLKNPF